MRSSGVAVLVAVLGTWLWLEATPAPRVAPPPGQAIAIDKSSPAQSERKLVIDRLVADGLVRSVDPRRGVLRVSLRPPFYMLDEQARRKYVEAIYGYYFDGSSVNDTVILRDARHGNEVGRYNPYRSGLTMSK